MREEEILAILTQRRHQQQSVAAAAAAVTPGLPSYLGTSQFLHAPFSLPTGVQGTYPMEAFLTAFQHQPFCGLSAATILELARQRPDMLASLQSPTPLHHAAAPEAVAAPGPSATSTPQPRPKRQRSKEEEEEEGENGGKQDEEEGEDEHDETEEEESPSSYSRPRKRAMFQLGDLGKSFIGDDMEDTEEDPANAWTADFHRSLVQGIFATGIRHASPSVLLDLMSNGRDFPLNSERVKSHLQKYRKYPDKSQADFMQEYDAILQRALRLGSSQSSRLLSTANVIQIMGLKGPLYGGDAAAAATYDILYKNSRPNHSGPEGQWEDQMEFDSAVNKFLTPSVLKKDSASLAEHCQGQTLEIPHLAPEEKDSPLGLSLAHIVDTFKALSNELDRQRTRAKNRPCKPELAAQLAAAAPPSVQQLSARELPDTAKSPRTVTQNNPSETPCGRQNLKTHEENKKPTKSCQKVPSPHNPSDKDQIGTLVDLMYKRKKCLDHASTPLTTRD